jgi:hypothetical protein
MSEEKGKRRAERPAAPQVTEEATLPAGLNDAIQATGLVPATEADAAVLAAAVPVGATLQGDAASTLGGLMGVTSPLGQFQDVMPTFGNVLMNIGAGVAQSQEEMDKSLVATVQKLRDATITVVTDVIQELDDQGLPDATKEVKLVTEEVSLLNYVPPTQHLWNRVALSMDLTVTGMSAENGMVFKQQQTQASGVAGSSWWGAYNWFDGQASTSTQQQSTRSAYEQQWSSGQVRLDATLGSRRMEKLPVGAEVSTGPQISFSMGQTTETKAGPLVRRAVEVTLQVRKRNGQVSPGQNLVVSSDPFPYAFATPEGSTTNATGKVVVQLTRDYPATVTPAPTPGTLSVKMGEMVRNFDITL